MPYVTYHIDEMGTTVEETAASMYVAKRKWTEYISYIIQQTVY